MIVFTTFPESGFAPETALDWYRLRWQVELAFKRFKSVAQLGHLPKRGGESSKAWLYGKLFTALLTERLIAHASALSPGGTTSRLPEATPRRWREFRFVPNQVRQTIEPDMPLREVMTDWPDISRSLSEPSRRRPPQIKRYFPDTVAGKEIKTS